MFWFLYGRPAGFQYHRRSDSHFKSNLGRILVPTSKNCFPVKATQLSLIHRTTQIEVPETVAKEEDRRRRRDVLEKLQTSTSNYVLDTSLGSVTKTDKLYRIIFG